jgi:sugar (pentulose or hexulose) kinase
MTLPRVEQPGTPIGSLRDHAKQLLGVADHCQLVLGCLDQYAGAMGLGCHEAGDVSETTGTVLAVVSVADSFDPAPGDGVIQGPAFEPGWYFRMRFSEVSASLLEATLSFAELDAEAAQAPSGAGGLILDRRASEAVGEPVFLNCHSGHTRGHKVRAILEGVAEELKAHVAAVAANHPPAQIRCTGGGARSDFWLAIKADKLGLPMVAIEAPGRTSLGAAMLAGVQLSEEGSVTKRVIHPGELRAVAERQATGARMRAASRVHAPPHRVSEEM